MSTYTGKVVREDADTLAVKSGGVINAETGGVIKANGTQAAHIADITDSATGAQIATAVNAILAVLEGIGATATK